MFEIFLTDIKAGDNGRIAELLAVDDRDEADRICITLQGYLREGIEAHFVTGEDFGYPGDDHAARYAQAVDSWVLDEAETLLDADGLRERLAQARDDLHSGRTVPVDHMTARDRIEKRIRGQS